MPAQTDDRPTRFRTAGISRRKPTHFAWIPDAQSRQELAAELGLLAIHRLEFSGAIDPIGRDELRLTGNLTAIANQACIITLVPVPAEIHDTIDRRYVAGLPLPEAEDAEIPEDDSLEPMPDTLDIPEIAIEALLLALPLYPRAAGAEHRASQVSDAVAPQDSNPENPFARLSVLSARLKNTEKPGGSDPE